MVEGDQELCPACGTLVGTDAWCAECGLDLSGSEAGEMRYLAGELAAAEAELQTIWSRRDALAKQLSTRQWARSTRAATTAQAPARVPLPGPSSTTPSGEWSVDAVRNFLLWTGAALLALSALAFTAVAWTHLGPSGRAVLLFVITIVAGVGASASRKRLPATSGALTGLAIALALVDWQIVRRAGAAPGMSSTAWWAIGTAVVGAASLALGRIASRAPAHRAFALLVPTSAVLLIAIGTDAAWSSALALSGLAAALAATLLFARDYVRDPLIRFIVRVESIVSWTAGAALALGAAFTVHTVSQSMAPAFVMLTLAVAPALVLFRSRGPTEDNILMAAIVIAAIIGAGLTMASTVVGPVGFLTLAAVFAGITIAIAPQLTKTWRFAAQRVGWLVALPGLLFAGSQAAIAMFGPWVWFDNVWTGATNAAAVSVVNGPETTATYLMGWCAVGVLVSVALATAVAFRPSVGSHPARRRTLWPVVPVGLLLLAAVLVPFAAGTTAGVTCAVATGLFVVVLVATAVVARRWPDQAMPLGLVAVIPAVAAAGWAALTPAASITVLAVATVGAFITVAVGREPVLRSGHAAFGGAATMALAAVVALAADASPPAAAFCAALAAGLLLVIGAQVRRDTADGIALELVGVCGLAVAAARTGDSPFWLAATLTVAVPFLLAAGLRRHRTMAYGIGAALVALGATWAWLGAAHVTVVEAYTLTAAAVALGLGALARRDGPAHSWLSLGPGIVLALGPTLALALSQNDDARAIAVGIAALAILLAGARQRLQAPIVLGGFTLVILAVEKLGPTAVRLPRWLLLAFAGSVLLWVGTTFERRRDGALRAARRFEQLG